MGGISPFAKVRALKWFPLTGKGKKLHPLQMALAILHEKFLLGNARVGRIAKIEKRKAGQE
ncbi:hypothetical protein H7849_16775 [Alloacidobacterium dinghuense]|uniref:Uncharacterized protein n=1 Tax=Alloacidobacterium dinghuense TaxID=2763107 RepID=A0A7G8BDZ6_9BACT|nr:hypothetical protein [Alloacidobacterium dinghuense]QNI30766.1 hypothetical protein H7849_16775 [Alloacidobacterium dinghuense]